MPLARSDTFSDRTRLMLSLRTPMNSIQRLWPIRAQLVRRLAVEELETLAAPNARLELAVGRQLLAVALKENVEGVFLPLEAKDDLFRLRLVDPLDERVLDQAEDRDLVVGRQSAVAAGAGEIDAYTVLVDERLDIATQRGNETEVVEDHRPELV